MKPGALLLDLDGTIFQGHTLIPGVLETLLFLQNAQIPYRFITNATRMTNKKLVLMMEDMGISVSSDDIFAAPHAAAIYCQNRGYKKILLAVFDREMEKDFSNFQLVDYNPDAIVLVDMGDGFTFNLINDLFNHILGGSELVDMHKN